MRQNSWVHEAKCVSDQIILAVPNSFFHELLKVVNRYNCDSLSCSVRAEEVGELLPV